MNNGITVANLIETYPDVLRNDKAMRAIGVAMATAFVNRLNELERIKIYTRIDELPEDLLDILAYDFKVDWWDNNYTLDEKRQTLKDSWAVHRTLGTKGAVEKAISAIYKDTWVTEWFEYGGEPYTFTLHIDSTYENVDPVKHQRVLDRLEYYKNLRSTPYRVEYTAQPFGTSKVSAVTGASCISGEMTAAVSVLPFGNTGTISAATALACISGEMAANILMEG